MFKNGGREREEQKGEIRERERRRKIDRERERRCKKGSKRYLEK
jgi:hypothetical protein